MRFQKPPTGAVLNPLHPLSRGLVGYWLFNEGAGSLVNDISGHGNHGKLTNMLPNVQGSGWGGGKSGGILQFDGINDYVNCGNDASLDVTDAITIEMWLKPVINTGFGVILQKDSWSKIMLRQEVGNQLMCTLKYSDATSSGEFEPFTFTADWQDVIITWDNSVSSNNLKGYRNSVLEQEVTSGYGKQLASSGADLNIGVSGLELYTGLIDSVRIYNRALSTAEVKMLYECPFCNLI
jgi:hypothetical protein